MKKGGGNRKKIESDDDEDIVNNSDDNMQLSSSNSDNEDDDDEDDEDDIDIEDLDDDDEDEDEDDEDNDDDDDDDELPKKKALTSRQLGAINGGLDISEFGLVTTKKKEISEEKLQKKHELAQARRQKKITETEAEMKDVVNQLLNRKTEKVTEKQVIIKPTKRELLLKTMGPTILISDNINDGKSVSFPNGYQFMENQPSSSSSSQQNKSKLCSAPGCNNPKRYNCVKNNLPVCTMECWKKVCNN